MNYRLPLSGNEGCVNNDRPIVKWIKAFILFYKPVGISCFDRNRPDVQKYHS
jgi:hypothetical protein